MVTQLAHVRRVGYRFRVDLLLDRALSARLGCRLDRRRKPLDPRLGNASPRYAALSRRASLRSRTVELDRRNPGCGDPSCSRPASGSMYAAPALATVSAITVLSPMWVYSWWHTLAIVLVAHPLMSPTLPGLALSLW